MIDLKENEISLNGQIEKIKCFEVWFLGVNGLYTTLEEAKTDCEKHEIDPNLLRPVSVAIGINGHYEIFMR